MAHHSQPGFIIALDVRRDGNDGNPCLYLYTDEGTRTDDALRMLEDGLMVQYTRLLDDRRRSACRHRTGRHTYAGVRLCNHQ